MRVQGFTDGGEEQVYDLFVRNDPGFEESHPDWMEITDATIIEVSEFSKCVKTDGLKLLPRGVLVAWKWKWDENNPESEDSSDSESTKGDHYNPYLDSDSDSGSDSGGHVPSLTHIVTFKCIGTTHDHHAQEVLCKVSRALKRNENIPVKLVPEPDNQYDSRAIAFKCKFEDEWHRIGYIVTEALTHVHKALEKKRIIFVKFAWVKYMVVWRRSGPGYYAGINIALEGEWSREVVRVASTR